MSNDELTSESKGKEQPNKMTNAEFRDELNELKKIWNRQLEDLQQEQRKADDARSKRATPQFRANNIEFEVRQMSQKLDNFIELEGIERHGDLLKMENYCLKLETLLLAGRSK